MKITADIAKANCTIECSKEELKVLEQAMWTLRMAAGFLDIEKAKQDQIAKITGDVQCAMSDFRFGKRMTSIKPSSSLVKNE